MRVGGAGKQDGLDLKRREFRVLASDEGRDSGHVRRGKTIAGAHDGAFVQPGHLDINPRRAKFDRRLWVVKEFLLRGTLVDDVHPVFNRPAQAAHGLAVGREDVIAQCQLANRETAYGS